MNGDDGCTMISAYLMPLNCTFKHGEDGDVYAFCIYFAATGTIGRNFSSQFHQVPLLRVTGMGTEFLRMGDSHGGQRQGQAMGEHGMGLGTGLGSRRWALSIILGKPFSLLVLAG